MWAGKMWEVETWEVTHSLARSRASEQPLPFLSLVACETPEQHFTFFLGLLALLASNIALFLGCSQPSRATSHVVPYRLFFIVLEIGSLTQVFTINLLNDANDETCR